MRAQWWRWSGCIIGFLTPFQCMGNRLLLYVLRSSQSPLALGYIILFFLFFLTTTRHLAFSNIILILLYSIASYPAYYKATIKTSTSIKRGYYKARYSCLSDINDHFRQVTKKVSKNRRFHPFPGFGSKLSAVIMLYSNSIIQ